MTIWEAMNSPLREVMVTCAMLILLYAGYLFLSFFMIRRKGKITVVSLVFFILSFAVFFLLLDGMFHYEEPSYFLYVEPASPRTWPGITRGFCSLPVWLLISLEIVFVIYLIVATYIRIQIRKSKLTRTSVKEALDLLPAGVVFAEETGNVVFMNMTMNSISLALTGKNLSDIAPLLSIVERTNEESGSDGLKSTYSDGERVWQFTKETILEREHPYIQLTATDISAEAAINEELKEKNIKLKEINRRLEIYNRMAEKLIISQELLNARMQVHNETGHILLASRHYMEHPSSMDEKAMLQTLKITNMHLLKEYEDDDTEKDPLTEAINMAGSIGVKVSFSGMIPENGISRSILSSAINECATNTKKHADGNLLEIRTEEHEDTIGFTLKSNGKISQKKVNETGGLGSLRTLVEKSGGTMEVTLSDVFLLNISIPK